MIDIKPVKGGFEDRIKEIIKQCESDSSENTVGWYGEDGIHPTADMSYPELAHFHATGRDGVAPRDVLGIARLKYDPTQFKTLQSAIRKMLREGNVDSYKKVMKALSKGMWLEAMSIIGSPEHLTVTNNPTPLLDTGSLKDKLAYKVNGKKSKR